MNRRTWYIGRVPKQGLHAPIVSMIFNQYKVANCINFCLAFLGIFIWYIEQEFYLSEQKSSLRFRLLWANLVVTILLVVSITQSYLLWIKFNNTWRPEFLWGIEGTQAQKRKQLNQLHLSLTSKRVIWNYSIEVLINLISPMPFFYNTYYPESNKGRLYK